jgi:hypothetical protein
MEKAAVSRSAGDPPSEDVLRRIRVPFIRRGSLSWDGHREDVFLVDLALNGVFIERAAPLPVGTVAEVQFDFPENQTPLVAACRVAWVRTEAKTEVSSPPAGCGLAFVALAPEDEARIRQYLTEYYRQKPRSRRFVSHEEDR